MRHLYAIRQEHPSGFWDEWYATLRPSGWTTQKRVTWRADRTLLPREHAVVLIRYMRARDRARGIMSSKYCLVRVPCP